MDTHPVAINWNIRFYCCWYICV